MISVIMSAYREPKEYIHCSVQSVLAQTYKELELIIAVDDPENTTLIAALEEYAAQDSRVKLHINTKNLGPAGARNAALSRATGEYIAILDADDYAMPQRLEKQLHFMQETGADLVGCRQQQFSDDAVLGDSPYLPEKQLRRYIRIANPLGHSGWLAKRAVYDALGGYRDIPKAEDFDFLLRAFSANYRILQQNEILIRYRSNPTGDSQSAPLRQFLTARYIAKNRHRLEKITKEKIERAVLTKITEKDRRRYTSAVKTTSVIAPLKKTNPAKWALLYIKVLFSSKYYFLVFLRSLRLKIIKTIYK